MKYCFAVLSTAVLIAAMPQALAASTVDLAVNGAITPAACLPNLSGGGVVDFDRIAAKDLRQTGSTPLPDHTLTLQVSCDSAIPFALLATDNRAGTASQAGSLYFGLGLINGSQKLGGYNIVMMNAVADGVEVAAIRSPDGKTDWQHNLFWWPT
ncbi:DUF1120 domain-containing protein [Pseudomonas sp. 681]|nr:DUF1120 domain-containing protein [Pseudomonas sp. 681]MDI2593911.1 DUF1120 domain-containing protein [Pseudomonas sp. 681]